MREKLVCIKCWRWYDDRTTCPTCKTPLIHADSGRPVTEMQAPPPPPPRTRATPTYYPPGVMPPAPGAPGGFPSVSGYPAGSPVAPPSAFTTLASIGRPRMVSTEPRATAKSWAPLAPQPVADFAFFSGASDPPPPPPAPLESPLATSFEAPAPPLPPPLAAWQEWGVPLGDAAPTVSESAPGMVDIAPTSETAAPVLDPAPPTWELDPEPDSGTETLVAAPAPVAWEAPAGSIPDALPPFLEPVPVTWDLEPVTIPLPVAPVFEPLPWLPDAVPVSQDVPPVTESDVATGTVEPAPVPQCVLSPLDPEQAGPALIADVKPPILDDYSFVVVAAPGAAAVHPAPPGASDPAPVPPPPATAAPDSAESLWSATPDVAQPMRGADGVMPPPAAESAEVLATPVTEDKAAPEQVPEPAPAVVARTPSLLIGAAAAFVVALVVSALWIYCAVKTGTELPAFAMLVGCAAGLTLRRLGGAGALRAAVASGVVAVLAVAVGLVLAAVAVISYSGGDSFLTAVTTLDRSYVPHIWAQIGAVGVALGAAGVILAGLLVVVTPGRRSRSA